MTHLNIDDTRAFARWADAKQRAYDRRVSDNFAWFIDIEANGEIPASSLAELKSQIDDFNFALYRLQGSGSDAPAAIRRIGEQAGLRELDQNLCAQEDRLTRLTVHSEGRANRYIPYSNRAIDWHTDGYYNPVHQRVLAMVLHCEQPADSGGENQLLDHDMAYIHLRRENPDYITALSRPEVMCIPENIENGELIRPQTCSAVFMVEDTGRAANSSTALAMRFSKRKRHITWADDALTQEALHCLLEFLDSDSPYHVRHRLNAGEGVINNNVLHTRTAFTDSHDHKRVYYRARYYNRIAIQ